MPPRDLASGPKPCGGNYWTNKLNRTYDFFTLYDEFFFVQLELKSIKFFGAQGSRFIYFTLFT